MSSIVRSYQRQIIKNKCRKEDGNLDNFKSKWKEFHYKDAPVYAKNLNSKGHKKKYHLSGKQFIERLKLHRQLVNAEKQRIKEERMKEKELLKHKVDKEKIVEA